MAWKILSPVQHDYSQAVWVRILRGLLFAPLKLWAGLEPDDGLA